MHDKILNTVKQTGAVLCRNTGINSASKFDFYLKNHFLGKNRSYEFGVLASRDKNAALSLDIGRDPPKFRMIGHTDLSYDFCDPPQLLIINSIRPAKIGGATPIYDLKNVEKNFQKYLPDLYANVKNNGIM